ncbi:MAG: response regulator [Polyangiaceae bacterium]
MTETRPMRILLADDDVDLRALVQMALSRDGHEIVEAENGAEVLDCLERAAFHPESMPDVIVVDVLMPKCSGLGVLEILKKSRAHVPVIVMTSFEHDSVRQVAERLGAVAFFRKPFDVEALRSAVRDVPPRSRHRA